MLIAGLVRTFVTTLCKIKNSECPYGHSECEDKTIEMFLRFRCLDLNTRRVCRRYQFYVGILSINSFIVVDLKTIPKPSTSCVAKAVPVGTACN